MNQNWTDNLRQRMEQYESTEVPEGLWEGIEQKLDSSPHAVVVPVWRRWAAACVAVGIIGMAGMSLMMDGDKDAGSLISIHRKSSGVMTSVAPMQKETHPSQTQTAVAKVVEAKCNRDTAGVEQVVEEEQPQTPEYADAAEKTPAAVVAENKTAATPAYTAMQTSQHADKARRNKLKVGMYTSYSLSREHLGMEGYLALSAQGLPANEPYLLSKGNVGTMDYLALTNDGANPVTDAYHNQPVRVGVSVGYDINKRWGVNIGVAYTLLESTLIAGTESSYYVDVQSIKYVGVPVSMTYNLLNFRRLRLYAMAGGMVEFGAGGESLVEAVVNNRSISFENHQLHDIPVQLSATVGGGAELKMNRSLGLYAEAGAAYFFDNNSDYATIYSTHPLNLNLQFGVRWTLNPEE